jgi:hypothetical protein
MRLVSADGKDMGKVLEVLKDVGSVESFGQAGIPPQQDNFNATKYGYSDAMPGSGDNYFVARGVDGKLLYVPFNAIQGVTGEQVAVAADAATIADLGWRVRPDVLAGMTDQYPEDEGAESLVA